MTERTSNDKNSMKIQYLEKENSQLRNVIEDLHQNLKINKQIIKQFVDQRKSVKAGIDYTFDQLNHENELLER